MKDEGVCDEQELGKDWVVALDEAWRVVEADQTCLDDLQRALCYDQDADDGEAWQTADNPVKDGHVCCTGSWQYGEQESWCRVCIEVD